MSCWKCNKSFKEGFEYCLECDAYIHAYCYICYNPIYAARTDDINMIYQDDLTIPVGRPICGDCFILLNPVIPEHLNFLKRYFDKKWNAPLKKLGLEKWI